MLWCLPSGRVGNECDVPTTLQIKSLSSSWEDTLRIDHMNVSSTIISASSREVSAQWCFKMIPRFIFAEKKLNSDCNLSFKALNHQYCLCCFSDCAAGIFTVVQQYCVWISVLFICCWSLSSSSSSTSVLLFCCLPVTFHSLTRQLKLNV